MGVVWSFVSRKKEGFVRMKATNKNKMLDMWIDCVAQKLDIQSKTGMQLMV